MKGHALSFTIPKPYLIGGLSTFVIIYPITNTVALFIMAYLIFQNFGNICVSKLLFASCGIRDLVA